MSVTFVGSNPAVLLKDDGVPVAFAAVWVADWSIRGTGAVLVLVRPDGVRVVADDVELAHHLTDCYTRHFGEVAQVGGWRTPTLVRERVDVTLQLGRGVRAVGGGVLLEISGPSAPELVKVDAITLGTASYDLVNVTAACSTARVAVDGAFLAGTPDPAFLAVAESWSKR